MVTLFLWRKQGVGLAYDNLILIIVYLVDVRAHVPAQDGQNAGGRRSRRLSPEPRARRDISRRNNATPSLGGLLAVRARPGRGAGTGDPEAGPSAV